MGAEEVVGTQCQQLHSWLWGCQTQLSSLVADVMASQQRMIEQMLAHSAGSQHSGYRQPKAVDLMMQGG